MHACPRGVQSIRLAACCRLPRCVHRNYGIHCPCIPAPKSLGSPVSLHAGRVSLLPAGAYAERVSVPVCHPHLESFYHLKPLRHSVSALRESARLEIREGFFHLTVSNISAALAFSWRWQEAGLQGSGDGELQLTGGTADYVFVVSLCQGLNFVVMF